MTQQQDNKAICKEIASLQKKLEGQKVSIEKANTQSIQDSLDNYEKSRKYMNDAFEIMSPKAVFLQQKQLNQPINGKDMMSQALLQIQQGSCQEYFGFEGEKYQKACNKLILVQSSSADDQDYCELAKTEGDLLTGRKINGDIYLKDTVCHSVYIIELLDAIITELSKVTDGSRKTEIDAALAKVKLARENAKCLPCQNNQYFTGEYNAHKGKYVKRNNIRTSKNESFETCIEYCNSTEKCRSFDFDSFKNGNTACYFNKLSYKTAQSSKQIGTDDPATILYDKKMQGTC